MNIESAISTLASQGLHPVHLASCRALSEALSEAGAVTANEAGDIIRKAEGITRLGKTRHRKVLSAGVSVGLWKTSEDELGIERTLPVGDGVPGFIVAIRRGSRIEVPQLGKSELGFYEGDPELRELALASSSCFGGYVAGNKECGACPLRGFCAETLKSRISAEASVMARELAEAISRAEAEADTPADTPAEASEGVSESGPSADETVHLLSSTLKVKKVVSPFTAHCSADCGKEVVAGTEGVSVAGHGFYHPPCAASTFA